MHSGITCSGVRYVLFKISYLKNFDFKLCCGLSKYCFDSGNILMFYIEVLGCKALQPKLYTAINDH